ncbi:hypothetical protein [uncultured Enterococcus sp.]|uniref:hypothetical protein n=1 Tax=uncultured Enterococcus sp. TaxID=167972 RepID=UPI002AA92EBA|nr:hypothetical protein [uncultured Enterococcus sp.]
MTSKLALFKTTQELQQAFLSWAAIDILLEEDYAYRVYDWIPTWTEALSFGKIDNGSGDELIAVFGKEDCIIKGFDHESALSPYAQEEYKIYDGIYDQVPKELLERLYDSAIEHEHVTFCFWLEAGSQWKKGATIIPEGADDGEEFLTGYFHTTVQEHCDWIEGYYERANNQQLQELVQHIFDKKVIDRIFLANNGFEERTEKIIKDLKSIAYPIR